MKNPKVFIRLVTNLEFMNWDWKKNYLKDMSQTEQYSNIPVTSYTRIYTPSTPCWLVNSVREEEEKNCERDLSTER